MSRRDAAVTATLRRADAGLARTQARACNQWHHVATVRMAAAAYTSHVVLRGACGEINRLIDGVRPAGREELLDPPNIPGRWDTHRPERHSANCMPILGPSLDREATRLTPATMNDRSQTAGFVRLTAAWPAELRKKPGESGSRPIDRPGGAKKRPSAPRDPCNKAAPASGLNRTNNIEQGDN